VGGGPPAKLGAEKERAKEAAKLEPAATNSPALDNKPKAAEEEKKREAVKMNAPSQAISVKDTPAKEDSKVKPADESDDDSSSGMSSSSGSDSGEEDRSKADPITKKEKERRQLIERLKRMKELLK